MSDSRNNGRTAWQTRIQQIEPAALLVKSRLLRRVARMAQGVSMFSWRVPHSTVLVLSRERLLELATEDELGVQHLGELPEQVMLIAWPDGEREDKSIAQQLASRLVHGWTHLCWLNLPDSELPQRIQQRQQQLGQCEWEEIVAVAEQDRWLPQRAAPAEAIYREFVAYWWELRWVYPERLPIWFPTLARRVQYIDSVVAQDVDGRRLQDRLRFSELLPNRVVEPYGAMNSSPAAENRISHLAFSPPQKGQESLAEEEALAPGEVAQAFGETPALSNQGHPHWKKIVALAQRGNLVRAARLCWLQAQQAQPSESLWWQQQTRLLIGQLAERLVYTLAPETAENAAQEKMAWQQALWPLVAPAASGLFSQEARLLYDLQRVGEDARRGVYAIDLGGWLRSLGRLPWRRQQPLLQQFLVLRRLRSAYRRLLLCSLPPRDREALAHLLHSAMDSQQRRLRDLVAPEIRLVLEEVGLVPHNLPERIEQERLIQSLTDRVVETGHLSLGQFRDAISANQLKLPDLNGPAEWWRGDPLLAADKRLSEKLDGIYRRGEIYLRGLQRGSSMFFGTRWGRWFSLFVALPFGGAYLILEGLNHILVHPLGHWLHAEADLSGIWGVMLFGLFLLGVINFPRFRRSVKQVLRSVGTSLRLIFWDWPRWLFHWPPLQQLWQWPGLVFFRRYLFLPLSMAVFTYAYCRVLATGTPLSTVAVICAATSGLVFTATREGRILLATIGDYLAWSFRYLSLEWIVLGLNWIVDLFRNLVNSLEQVQYRIDEWLRYRGGESRWRLATKALLSWLWSVIAYVLRFTVYLLIEPQINPIKHFPVVTVSHKLLLATIPFFRDVVLLTFGWEATPANQAKAVALVTSVIWAIPGIFGFLAWELKENWRLYAANRSRCLSPLRVGHHGETLPQLLRPGAHSGTLRKLFRRWRRRSSYANRASSVATIPFQEQRRRLAESIQLFIHRNLVLLLQQLTTWRSPLPQVADVHIGISAIEIALRPNGRATSASLAVTDGETPAMLRFGLQGGWIVARWLQIGWISQLPHEQKEIFAKALAGLYHWAGVEVVAEQLNHLLQAIETRDGSGWSSRRDHSSDRIHGLSSPTILLVPTDVLSAGEQETRPTPNMPGDVLGAPQACNPESSAPPVRARLTWWLDWQGLRVYDQKDSDRQVFYRWQDNGLIEPEVFTRQPGRSSTNCHRGYETTIATQGPAFPWPVITNEHIWFSANPLSWDTWLNWWTGLAHSYDQRA